MMKKFYIYKSFLSIYFITFSIIFFSYFLIPTEYKVKTIIKPISQLEFDNKLYEIEQSTQNISNIETIKKLFENNEKIFFQDEKKIIIKIENVDNLNNVKLSPLVIFFEYFKILEKKQYEKEKFKIFFFEDSFEYFFLIEKINKNKLDGVNDLNNLINFSYEILNEKINTYLKNRNINKSFNKNEISFIHFNPKNIVVEKTKISFTAFLLFNLIFTTFFSILLWTILCKLKFIVPKKK